MSYSFADSLRAGSGRNSDGFPSWFFSLTVSKPIWHKPLLCEQWKTTDDGQRNCPKHVEFYSKIKSEKLEHLVGFIIKIFGDAQSPEHQIDSDVMHTLAKIILKWNFIFSIVFIVVVDVNMPT